MKCTIPEISWHNREPVLSLDIQPQNEGFSRLATGGADCHVLIWQLNPCDNGAVKIEILSDLTRHQKAVNCVRWSPTGEHLATADDDANIIVWQLKTDNIPLLEGETSDKETWIVHKVMRGHKEDIYDLSWSPNGKKILSGSVDNTAILWDLAKGINESILTDHKGFVQGVCWDPKSIYFATISTDRICRIYEKTGRPVKARISKGLLPVPSDHYLHDKEVKYFHDDTFKSFFRRLDFSPDGSLLAVPSGRVEVEDCKKVLCGTFVFAVEQWSTPVAIFPSGKQCSTVVRFCPILYELHDDGPDPIISLPFRMILAVGTDHDIILYDTQQLAPFAYFKDIHYTRLTDLAWSRNGSLLLASSTDGFCSLITFEQDELGVPYVKDDSEIEESVLDVSGCEELEKDEISDLSKPKKPNFLETWAKTTPKRNKCDEAIQKSSMHSKNDLPILNHNIETDSLNRKVRRITPISVQSNKQDAKMKPPHKSSPLHKFLKATNSKAEVIENKRPSNNVTVIDPSLDENEARDAWKCGKDDKSNLLLQSQEVIILDDNSEDFSLHLDSDSKSCVGKGGSQEVNTETSIKDCNPTLEKTTKQDTTKPKRRIPLITLSSPKQKKK